MVYIFFVAVLYILFFFKLKKKNSNTSKVFDLMSDIVIQDHAMSDTDHAMSDTDHAMSDTDHVSHVYHLCPTSNGLCPTLSYKLFTAYRKHSSDVAMVYIFFVAVLYILFFFN